MPEVSEVVWDAAPHVPAPLKVSRDADQKQFDASLAQEFNSLSIQDRELSYEEVHGVAEIMEENPEMLERHLAEFDVAVQHIAHKPAYDLAYSQDPGYLHSRKFRLMFLRSDRFVAADAAQRMVRFLEKKRNFFGEQCLTRSLMLQDLSKDELASLKTPTCSVLPSRDRSGRLVMAFFPFGGTPYSEFMATLRSCMFTLLALLEDEETQKRGIVQVSWYMGNLPSGDLTREFVVDMCELPTWMPFRVVGYHMCMDNNPINALLGRAVSAVVNPKLRRVRKLHHGTPTEVMYELLSYGVPVDSFPLTTDGLLKKNSRKKYIQRMRSRDAWIEERHLERRALLQQRGGVMDPNEDDPMVVFPKTDLPMPNDVLLGQGKPYQHHTGTVNLRWLVDDNLDAYTAANKADKAKMTWMIVRKIQTQGRFLKKEKDDWWVVATDEEARARVGKTFFSQSVVRNKAAATERVASASPPTLQRDPTTQEAIAPLVKRARPDNALSNGGAMARGPAMPLTPDSTDSNVECTNCYGFWEGQGGGNNNFKDLVWGNQIGAGNNVHFPPS
eukprot:Nitzschia sp. Nitz4//scaffold313_size41840//25742//27504//NITZ4_007437-RA/size41840-snap-gene-0.32-mRNA-1//1//CDS//3329547433//1639//frame0